MVELRIEISEEDWAKIKRGVRYEDGVEDEAEVKECVEATMQEWLLDKYDSYIG